MQATDTIADSVSAVLRSALADVEGVVYAVEPTERVFEALVDVADELEAPPTVRVVADERVLKSVLDDFIVASSAADLVDAGTLSLRTTDDTAENAMLVTEEGVVAVVRADERAAGLVTDDAAFVEAAVETYEAAWEDAAEYTLRTPSISRVRETLDEQIGADARADFDAVLGSLGTARGNGDGLDEVTVSLLVAAKNEELLYDISKWGEDVGIASKATFSRTKTELEELGLIDTEKVPIDVGRPRLRLKLGDDRLQGADAAELASVAGSLLT